MILVFVLISASSFLFGMVTLVAWLYFLTWRRSPMLAPNRLISLHVWTVAISFACILGVAAGYLVFEPHPVAVAVYVTGLVFGVYGLLMTAKSQRRKAGL